MVNSVIQPSFASGEVAPSYRGRVDLAKYHAGVALMRNFFVDVRGGASTRQGTEYIGRAKNSSMPVRVIPFQFSTLQTYTLEFGHEYIRFITNGAYVLEANITINGINNANPAIVSATAHGYSNGDWVYIQNVVGMPQINGQFYIVSGATTNTFALTDLDGNTINSISYGVYTSGGTVARIYTLTTPYQGVDLALLKYTQSADVMTITNNSYAAMDLNRMGNADWSLTTITFAPSIDAPTITSVTPSASGSTYYTYVVTTISAATGEESIESVPMDTALSATMSTTSGANVAIVWTAVTGALQYSIYRQQEVPGGQDTGGGLYGYVGTSLTASFIDVNVSPDFSRTPPYEQNPFADGNYPGCCTYFQQRKVFGNTVNDPQTFYMTQPGAFNNFDVSIITRDSDAITATLAAEEVNAIQFLVPMSSLIALTISGAWQITGSGQDAAITPSSLQAKPQAYNGCDMAVLPLKINYDILYVPYLGSGVYDLTYNFIINSYYGEDISVLSSHFFFGYQILQWTWQEVPLKLVWAVRNDGKLLSMTYYKTQDLYGWAQHDTQGHFESICSIAEGQENAVYMVVERLINGQYVKYIERFANRIFTNDVNLAWCVDCGLTLPWTFPNATCTPTSVLLPTNNNYLQVGDTVTITTSSPIWSSANTGYALRINSGKILLDTYISPTQMSGTVVVPLTSIWYATASNWSIFDPVTEISGLEHLEGMVVTGLADGAVINGIIINGSLSPALSTPASDIIIGLGYTCQLQNLPLDISAEGTIQGKRKKIGALTLRVVESRGLMVGSTFDTLKPIKERMPSMPYGIAIPLQTTDERINLDSSWQEPGQVCIEQSYPLPATICAIVPEIKIGDM